MKIAMSPPATAEVLRGNPPMHNFVKRRWDDDVVFRNQGRGETKTPKNDFQRKFLNKYLI